MESLFDKQDMKERFELFNEWWEKHYPNTPTTPRKRKNSYTDEMLTNIISDAPTKANATKWAATYGRSTGAITMIYRNVYAPANLEDKFRQQIQRIAKAVGVLTLPKSPSHKKGV